MRLTVLLIGCFALFAQGQAPRTGEKEQVLMSIPVDPPGTGPGPRVLRITPGPQGRAKVAMSGNILFPFIPHGGGLDTGIAISATYRDPFDGSKSQLLTDITKEPIGSVRIYLKIGEPLPKGYERV